MISAENLDANFDYRISWTRYTKVKDNLGRKISFHWKYVALLSERNDLDGPEVPQSTSSVHCYKTARMLLDLPTALRNITRGKRSNHLHIHFYHFNTLAL